MYVEIAFVNSKCQRGLLTSIPKVRPNFFSPHLRQKTFRFFVSHLFSWNVAGEERGGVFFWGGIHMKRLSSGTSSRDILSFFLLLWRSTFTGITDLKSRALFQDCHLAFFKFPYSYNQLVYIFRSSKQLFMTFIFGQKTVM